MKMPKFLQRKANPALKSYFAMYGSGNAVWTPKNYAALAQAGYQNNAAVFTCVQTIAKAASRINWVLYRKAGKEWVEVDQHPILDLLKRPNETESGIRFSEKAISHLMLAGNSYVLKVAASKLAPPSFLYTLRPDRMKVKLGNWQKPIAWWEYSVGGNAPEKFDPDDVLHLTEFHPTDDWYGLSRLEVASWYVDIANQAAEWNKKLLQNDMKIPGIVTGTFGAMDQATLKNIWRERFQGYDNAGMPLFLDGDGIDFKPVATSPKEVDWLEGQKFTFRQIYAIFGVDPCLGFDQEYSTLSNKKEARKALYQDTVLPIMDIYRDELDKFLVKPAGDDLRLDYDRDSIEALQEDREKKYSYLKGADWLKVNEKRTATGYDDLGDGEGGDAVMVPMGNIPLADAVADAGAISDTDEPKSFKPCQTKSLGSFWRGATERKALWRNYERRVVLKERAFAREVKSYLDEQAAAIVARVAPGVTSADGLLGRDEGRESFKRRFQARYRKVYASALAAGRRMTKGELYEYQPDDADKAVSDETLKRLEQLIDESARVITDETIAEIQSVLRAATGTNLTTQEIANALGDKLGTMSPVRARRIARTETGMLENFGNLDGFRENEFVTGKGWLCSFVEASRDAHQEADGQEVGIDEDFTVGGERMAYPGDRRGGASAGNVVNCLCAIYPVTEG